MEKRDARPIFFAATNETIVVTTMPAYMAFHITHNYVLDIEVFANLVDPRLFVFVIARDYPPRFGVSMGDFFEIRHIRFI